MANAHAGLVLRNPGNPVRDVGDLQLLQRFVAYGDEAAFADLVHRHGGTVWRVCRRVLHQEQDAEDAFQAVFLILARKAASIRKGEAVGSWLYGVAYRTAMKARQSAARRQDAETQAAQPASEPAPPSEAACRELQRLLDEEVQRLAAKFRAPFVLCCLEGMSKSEAARELGWKEGTVSGRLAQARKLLQKRLVRRGVTLSGVLTAVVLTQQTAAAAAPVALVQATVHAALAPLAGKSALAAASPSAITLAESLLRSMVVAKLKTALFLLLGLTTLVAGAGLAASQLGTSDGEEAEAQEPAVVAEPEIFVPPPVPFLQPIDEQVLALAFSPDGKRLVTGGARHTLPGQLKIWDVASAGNLASIRGTSGIRTLAISPDGQVLATGEFGGAIRLRDPGTGQERAVLQGHTIGVNGLVFSADGTLLASAGLDKAVKLWDVQGRHERQVFLGHTDMVFSVAFFRHGQAIVTGGQDKTARIWDLRTGKEKFLLQGHQAAVEMVAISPDDKIVATASWDQTIKLWDAATGKETGALTGKYGSVLAVAFSPDGTHLASAAGDGIVRLWDVKAQLEIEKLAQHGSSVWSLAFTQDGKLLASGSSDKTAKLWDLGAKKEVATLNTSESGAVRALAYAPDGQAVAIATDDNKVRLRHAKTGDVVLVLPGHGDEVNCLAFSPDGKTLASGSSDTTVKVWDRASGKEDLTFKAHTGAVYALAFTPDGKQLASAGDDKVIRVWDPASGQELATFKGHEGSIRALAFAPDGKSLASGSADQTIRVWDRSQQAGPITLKGHEGGVWVLAFSPAGILASAGEDGVVRLWEPVQGKERLVCKGHRGGILALAFAPSGRTLVSGGLDRTIRLWDATNGQPRGALQGHKHAVTALTIHPQGLDLITGGSDAVMLRWRGAKGEGVIDAPEIHQKPGAERTANGAPPGRSAAPNLNADSSTPPVAATEGPVSPKAAEKGWLTAGLIIGLVLLSCLVGGWLSVRRAGEREKGPQPR